MDLATLDLNRVIVHELPAKHRAAEGQVDLPEPRLSHAPSPLEQASLNYLRMRVIRSLSEGGIPARFASDESEGTRGEIELILDDELEDAAFVAGSQELARRLFDSQNANVSPGMLVVATGNVAGRACLIIIKLERETGVEVEETEVDGETTLTFVVVEDRLFMTENTRVFKTGLFVAPQGDEDDPEVLIADAQTGGARGPQVARFFREAFLECEFADSPSENTRVWFVETERWIRSEVNEPVTATTYLEALQAETKSNRQSVSPARFARDHLSVEHQNAYIDHLSSTEAPTKQFRKDTTEIKAVIERVEIRVGESVMVTTAQALEEGAAAVEALGDGNARVSAVGEFRGVKGRGKR